MIFDNLFLVRKIVLLNEIIFSLNLHNKERVTALRIYQEEEEKIKIISVGRNGKINFSLFDENNSQGIQSFQLSSHLN